MSSYKEERTEYYKNAHIVAQILSEFIHCSLQVILRIAWMESVEAGGWGCEQRGHLW